MKIEINIDDKELQKKVTEIVAKRLLDDYCSERREVHKVVEKAVKDVISADREKIVEMAIDKAAGKIAYGAAPKLVEKLMKGGDMKTKSECRRDALLPCKLCKGTNVVVERWSSG